MQHNNRIFKQLLLILLIGLLCMGNVLFSEGGKQWISLTGDAAAKGGEPQLSVSEADGGGMSLSMTINGFFMSTHSENRVRYNTLQLGQYNGDLPEGSPNLPTVRQYIYIPAGKQARLVVTPGTPVTLDNYRVFPVQPPQPDVVNEDGYTNEFHMDEAVYRSNRIYPAQMAFLDKSKMVRGHQVAMLHVCPFQFNPAEKTLQVYPDINVSIVFEGEENKVDQRLEAREFDKFITGFVLNPKALSPYKQIQKDDIDAGTEMIIITAPSLVTAANSLKTHKDGIGISTTVVTTDTTGTTNTAIKSYIQNAFDTWSPAPTYVILLGDADHVPTFYENTHPYHSHLSGTDLYYSTLSGTDYEPDIFLGRMSVDDLSEATTVVNKIINYETSPPTAASFYANALMAAYYQDYDANGYADRRFAQTSEEVRDFFLNQGYNAQRVYKASSSVTPTYYNNTSYSSGEPIPEELLRSNGFAWDGDAADVSGIINDGVFFLLHRDHGGDRNGGNSHTGWGDPEYDERHVAALTNGNLLPVVLSMNCMTGWFDGETDTVTTRNYESFCELFLRQSTGGAVSVIGASRVSYSGYNDYLAKGMIDSIWPDFLPTVPNNSGASSRLGPMMNHGKVAMSLLWQSSGTIHELEYEIFHVLGDPSLEMLTRQANTQGTQSVVVRSATEYGVPITVSQNDINGNGNGNAYFTRTYAYNATVTLTAPATYNGDVFSSWTVDGSTVATQSIQLTMNQFHTVTATYTVTPGSEKMLIIDLDGNINSGTVIQTALQACGAITKYVTALPSSIAPQSYPAVFVCLGTYSNNHTLSSGSGTILKNYLDAGGKLYMEGGDTWAYDTASPVHTYFGIRGLADGADNTATVNGVGGTLTDGLSFTYGGDNAYMDTFDTSSMVSGAAIIWNNSSPAYTNGISMDGGTYKTIGVSFEFAGIPAGQQNAIMRKYLDFLVPAPSVAISGTVTYLASPLSGVTLSGLPGSPVTDGSGNYSASVSEGWSGTATPTLAGYTFSPSSTVYSNVTTPQTDNYSATQPPSLGLTSPGYTDIWSAHSAKTITWNTTGISQTIMLRYSTAGLAGSWVTIVSAAPNTGSYTWTVPNVNSNQCIIRISTTSGLYADFTDTFTITPAPSVTVTTPNGGQKLQAGSSYHFRFSATNLVGDVTVDLYKGASLVRNIGTADAASGIIPITIAADRATGADYRIRVHQDGVEDYSDGYFTILGSQRYYVFHGSDFDGDSSADIAIFRPSNGRWCVKDTPSTAWGAEGDIPVSGDYDGDGDTDYAIFRPSTGRWCIMGQPSIAYGTSTDIPVPGDYDGDGTTDIAIYRPSTGRWCVMGQPSVAWGTSTDVPVPADYDGDGDTDIAIFRPSNGRWCIMGQPSVAYGTSTDIPVPADYDGDGYVDIAIFRPSTGRWCVMGQPSEAWGTSTDIPIPADYDGDGDADFAIFRASSGTWAIKGIPSVRFGTSTDIPLISHKGN
ncbi:MAG: hypothetical protein GY765_43815 [bacterium]|nr:hypothetical protein [bacterium]